MRWTHIFGPLTSRNYRLYFSGQVVSLIGTWMTQTASMWLVYHLSSSAFLLGVVGFASLIPTFVFGPFAGVLVDRVNRHKLLIGTQVCAMLQSFALAYFALTKTIDIPHIIILSLVQGIINAIDMPVRQALVVEFVDRKEQLSNAIALNSSLFNLARLVGPAIGGFVIAGVGAGMCFLIDGLSYIAVIVALLCMRLRERPVRKSVQHPWTELVHGFHYTYHFAPIRALILLVASVSAIGFSYAVLTPLFAHDVFHGDAKTLGYLMSASGIGAVTGALYLGSRKTVRGLGEVITVGGILLGLGGIGFSLSQWLAPALVCLAMAGMGGVLLMASSNTLVQTLVDDDKRGRVMSIFSMAFTGTMPIGNLAVGAVAAKFGAPHTLALCGVLCIVIVLIFYQRLPKLRAAAAHVLARLDSATVEPVVYPVEEPKPAARMADGR